MTAAGVGVGKDALPAQCMEALTNGSYIHNVWCSDVMFCHVSCTCCAQLQTQHDSTFDLFLLGAAGKSQINCSS